MLLAIVETPQRFRHLTVYPIISADGPQLPYLLLSEALGSGAVSMEEHDQGTGPILIARNNGFHPVLILDRERLLGARRECTISRSILLGPRSVTEVPLACHQERRWSCPPRNRELDAALQSFPKLPEQVGAMAFLGKRFLGLDALGSPNLYDSLHRRLLAGYLAQVLGSAPHMPSLPEASRPEAMVVAQALQNAIREPCSAAEGHGEQWVLTGTISGRELCHGGFLVHLAVFPKDAAA